MTYVLETLTPDGWRATAEPFASYEAAADEQDRLAAEDRGPFRIVVLAKETQRVQ